VSYNFYSLVTEGLITLTESRTISYREYVNLLSQLSVKRDIENFQNFLQIKRSKEIELEYKNNRNNQ